MAEAHNDVSLLALPSRPVRNRLILLHIEGLTALDGSVLNGPIDSYYTSEFDPFYSNVMRVRLIAGQFLLEIPDDTVNQLIWYFSNEADLRNYHLENSRVNPTTYANFRARWVTISTIIAFLGGSGVTGLMSKRLGDLSVTRDRSADALLKLLMKELQDLTEILEDGGLYGRGMVTVTKSSGHPDTPVFGRMWAEPFTHEISPIPSVNTRDRFVRRSDGLPQSRTKTTFLPRSR